MNTLLVSSEAKWRGLSLLIPLSAEVESVKNHLHSICYHVQQNIGIAVLFIIHAACGTEHISPTSCVCNHCMSITFAEHLLLGGPRQSLLSICRYKMRHT